MSSHPTSQAPSPLEYDGSELPVLIRLPDLSETASVVPIETPLEEAAEEELLEADSEQVAQQAPPAMRVKIDQSESDTRSKLMVAALVVVVVGLTYAVIRGGGNEEFTQPEDRWALPEATSEPPRLASEPGGELTDLWPGQQAQVEQLELDPSASPIFQPADTFIGSPATGPQPGSYVDHTPAQPAVSSGQAWPTGSEASSAASSPVGYSNQGQAGPHDGFPQTGFPEPAASQQDSSYRTGRLNSSQPNYTPINSEQGARLNGIEIPQPQKRL